MAPVPYAPSLDQEDVTHEGCVGKRHCEQGPGRHLALLDAENRRDDAGRDGGDAVTMTLHWGYLAGTVLFLSVLLVLVTVQILAKTFHPLLYWATIIASTTFGTTMADFADRSLGIGYTGGSLLLFACLTAVLAVWYRSQGTIDVTTVATPKIEAFYWAAITFSQTLGTALGDWLADTGGLG